MNNQNLFEKKYLKYKSKYLSLKKQFNQKGLGNPPFECMVIGGGNPDLYGDGFFEVGNHPNANFGKGRDWNDPKFWTDLDEELRDKQFQAIVIDKGSASWLRDVDLDNMCLIIIKHIFEEGIVLIEGPFVNDVPDDIYSKIRQSIVKIGFNPIGKVGFGMVIDNDIYTIYSQGSGSILSRENVNSQDEDVGTWDPRGFIIVNPGFTYVTEPNQIEFIRNRIL